MRLLFLHILRSVVRMRIRLLAVCLIAAIGFAVYVGVYSAIDSLTAKRDSEYARGNLADLELRFAPEDPFYVPDFSDVDGVRESQSRLLYPGRLPSVGGAPLAALLVTVDPEMNRLNRLAVAEGQGLDRDRPGGVVIDRDLAVHHGCANGDRLELALADETYELEIVGVGTSPEFLLAPINPNIFVPAVGSLGVVYAVPGLIESRVSVPLVNSLLFRFEAGAEASAVGERIVAVAETGLVVDSVTTRNETFSYEFLNLHLEAFRIYLPALVLVFDVTAFLVTLFLVTQWISQERRHIGTHMALGYGARRICVAHLVPTLVIGVVALALGYALSHYVAYSFAVGYADAISFPRPEIVIGRSHLVRGTIGLAVVLLAASLGPQLWLLRLTPLEAVRETARAAQGKLGRWGRAVAFVPGGLWLRYGLRNLLRTKVVSAMTILAIALGFGITISLFVNLTSSLETALAATRSDPWHALVDFFAPIAGDDIAATYESIEGVERAAPYLKLDADLHGPVGSEPMALVGVPPGAGMRCPEILEGRSLRGGDEGSVMIEKKLADRTGTRVGDTVTLERGGTQHEVEVVGLLSGALPGESYIPLELAQEMAESPDRCSGLFLVIDGDPQKVREEFLALDNIAQVTLKASVVEQIVKNIEEILVIVRIGAVFSIAIAFLFVFCSISFAVLQRKSEYVMLRIIGFGDGTVAATIVAEVLLLGAIACLLAVPIGYYTAAFLNERISQAWYNVTLVVDLKDFLRTLIPGLLLMPVAALLAIRTVLNEPLDKNLRERRHG